MVDERENIRPPEKSLTPGVKPDAKVVAPISPHKDVPIGFGVITPEMERYRAMIAKDPTSRVFAALAELYRKAGMLDEAVRLCLNGTKAHPKYMSGRVSLARAYFDKGMVKEAKEEVLTVVSITPDNIVANKILGDIYLMEGDTVKARESLEKVLSLSPDDLEAKEKLGEAGRVTGKSTPPPGEPEEILDGEALEVVAEGETPETAGDAAFVGEDKTIETGDGAAPIEMGDAPIEGKVTLDASPDLDIPLDDDGSLDSLLTDELAVDAPEEQVRESNVQPQIPGDGSGAEEEAWEAEGEDDGGAMGNGSGIASDQEEGVIGLDLDEDQELVDEFGILDEAGADITVEGLDNGDQPSARPTPGPRKDAVPRSSDDRESGKPPQIIKEAPEAKEDTSDAQGMTITTETIADIYVKQGYFERALSVYEELLGIYPTRDSLKQKIAFVKKKIKEMTGDDQRRGAPSIDGGRKGAEGDVPGPAEDEKLRKNVEGLNRWLLSIRKYRRS